MAEDRNIRRRIEHWMMRPKKDNFGLVGHPDLRYAEGHFVSLFSEPVYYSSTMTGHETFTDPLTMFKVYFLDPNGANRNFNPSGDFRTGFTMFIKNIDDAGNYIVFDSAVGKHLIGPGELGIFAYNGTLWL